MYLHEGHAQSRIRAVVFDRKALPAGWAKMREIRSDLEAYGEPPGCRPQRSRQTEPFVKSFLRRRQIGCFRFRPESHRLDESAASLRIDLEANVR